MRSGADRASVPREPTRALVALAALAACGDPAPTIVGPDRGCTTFCDDGDPCTDDLCEPSVGRCIFVPRDAVNACLNDLHCDDGVACTTDRCALDPECGLQRCVNEGRLGCADCGGDVECTDGDACSIEICERDTCGHMQDVECDRRCDPTAEAGPDEARAVGRVVPLAACAACPCATGIGIETADGVVPVTTAGAEGGTCTATCDGDRLGWDCRPFVFGIDYVVWGRRGAVGIEASGWCPTTDAGLAPGTYTGALDLDEGAVRFPIEAVFDDPTEPLALFAGPCGCDVFIVAQEVALTSYEGIGRAFTLEVFGGSFGQARLEARLTPGPRGWRGALVDLDRGGRVGRLELELERGPRFPPPE
ncbi:MAG: hypothetical protein IT385_13675 [Deltaproteobacteria bacterium]|nr:hypothetical protein [Deltaproteobacteria bacterium]